MKQLCKMALRSISSNDSILTTRKEIFRALSPFEEEAIHILDNRNLKAQNPTNHLFLTCEHASNEYLYYHSNSYSIKYMVHKKKIRALMQAFRLHDPGSEECTIELSEKLNCIGCLASFSKVVIDANSSLLSGKLYSEIEKSDFTTGLFNPHERISLYYGLYHELIREVIHWIEPKYHISIHTKPQVGKGDEIEVVYKDNSKLAEEMVSELAKKGIKASCGELIEFETGINRAVELAFYPEKLIKSIRINIKEGTAINELKRPKLLEGLASTINKTFTP